MLGFTTQDGYAAVPFGDNFMIIYRGQQIDVVNSEEEAQKFIENDRAKSKTETPKLKPSKKSTPKGIDRSLH